MIEKEEVIGLVSELVGIDSVNPWLVAGGNGEGEVGEFIASWLEPLGVEVTLDEVEPGRRNVVARWRGTGGGKSLCLYAHLDTVGCALWPDQAFKARVDGDHLIGLGAADDKGHCAAAMLGLKALVESGSRLRGDFWLSLPIDEEGTSSGAMDFVKKYQTDGALVLESVGLGHINVTHQGFGWLDIVVRGKAAHGSAPDVGVDAIVHMAEVVKRLHQLDQGNYTATADALNGKIVFHTGTIKGGTDYATYPDLCTLGIEIGTQPGESIDDRVAEIETIFAEAKEIYPDFDGQVKVKLAREPFEAHGHEDLFQVLAKEMEQQIGRPPVAVGENAWGDAALYQAAGIPTLMIGAEGQNLHAPEEWVSISELTALANIVAETARRFCG